jgi:hypothetical protein
VRQLRSDLPRLKHEEVPNPIPRAVWELAAVAGLTALALILRLHGYTAAPLFMDNADELNFAWAGINLILRHDAYTWSYFSSYTSHETLTAFGTTFPMVHHWLDHPPLFALVVGGWLWLLGVRDMLSVTPEQIRVLPVLFSTLTVPLVYVLGRRFVGLLPALVGAALLAAAPPAVLLGRVAEAESVLALVLLAALLLTDRAVRRLDRWSVAALLVCCLVAPLLKVPGIAIAGICAVILFAYGRWPQAAAAVAAGLVGLLLYVAYGALVDWPHNLRGVAEQASRRTGVMSGFEFVTAWAGINRTLRDGWWLLGWLGIAALAVREGRSRSLFLAWPAIAYAAVIAVLSGESEVVWYGWYRIIVYPEVYLAAGWVAWEAVQRRSLPLAGLVLLFGGATATNWWLGGPDAAWVPNPVLLCLLIAAVLGPAAVLIWRHRSPVWQRLALLTTGVTLALLLAGNAVESWWLDRIFDRL